MAGINTAVTGVGTAAGAGATVVGVIKANKDKEVEVKLEKLRQIEQQNPDIKSSDEDWDNFSTDMQAQLESAKQEIERYQAEIEKLLTGEGVRKEAGKTMPAKGLTLEEVFYEDLVW